MKIKNLWSKLRNWVKGLALEIWENIILKIWSGLNPENFFSFVTRNFLYLIWILLVPIILYSMAQGRELFTGLFDDTFFFSGFRASFLLVAFFAQGMAILLLPRPLFKDVNFEGWGQMRPIRELKDPGLTYFLSALPILMYGLVMIYVQIDRIPNWAWWLIVPTMLAAVIYAIRFERRWRLSIPKTLLIMLGNVVLCGVVVGWVQKGEPFWNYYVVGTCLLFQMALMGGLSKLIHEDFRRATNAHDPSISSGQRHTHRYDRLYWWSSIPVFLLVAGFATCPNLEGPTPTFMLLLLTTFYMLFTRAISAWYVFRIRCAGYKCARVWVFWALAIFFLYVVFFVKSGIHDIRTMQGADLRTSGSRVSPDDWFEAWWTKNNFDTTQAEIPIYLVAVQGGGSRAALWTTEMLNRLEVESGYQFHKHCFAITSASGGSVGTAATLALWRYAEENQTFAISKPGGRSKDSLYLDYGKGFAQRNYLSGSFFEIFVSEIGTRFLFGKKDRNNRNYRLQKDQGLGFAVGLERGYFPEPSQLSLRIYERLRLWDQGDAEELRVGKFKVKNYPFMEYLSYWYDDAGKPKPGLPLYLPITTNIQTGKAGFSSPIQMDPMLFTDAIDLLEAVEKSDRKRPNRTLSLIGATNLSELFPVMSAFTYIPGTGNFIDGGTYENMGLQVLQQIYFWLDRKRANDPRMAKVRVHFIYLINNQIENVMPVEESERYKVTRVSQVASPFKHASSTTIDGRTSYFTRRVAYDLNPKDTLHTLWLQAPDTSKLRIPLGRWLSRRSVRLAKERADGLQPQIEHVVRPLE